MTILDLPVRSDLASYEFTIELDSRNYLLRFRWNERLALWLMAVAKTDGTEVVAGVPVQTNTNLFGRFKSPDLPPGFFVAVDTSGNDADAGRDNFGGDNGTVRLLYQEAS